jgi:FG-GAP-like repeat/ASPIC and UnbV
MRRLIRVSLALVFCVGVAAGVVFWLVGPGLPMWPGEGARHTRRHETDGLRSGPGVEEPAGEGRGIAKTFDLVLEKFEDGGYETAVRFMAPVKDPGSLTELREAVRSRGPRALAALEAEYAQIKLDQEPSREQLLKKVQIERSIGFVQMYEGRFREASAWLEKAHGTSRSVLVPAKVRSRITAVLGIVAMRRGEIENCLECAGPSSCIFPIAKEARHQNPAGSREAIKWFTAFLEESPRDLRIIWLLNIAYMTLGEHPDKVPPQYLIPTEVFRSKAVVAPFENVALRAGMGVRGPNLAGGSIFDDFNGDNLPDLFTTSLDAELGATLLINRGDGRFEDRSAAAGLVDQVYALNVTRTDFDNDGDLDVLLLRGGWEKPLRMSLLRNDGGRFADVTALSGLSEPIASESAAWGDYDNDGFADVFVCGEYLPPGGVSSPGQGDPRNRSRLYRNQGDGTFKNVAEAAGVTNLRCAKGSAWGDYDGDGRIDLFVSNMGQPCRLYHSEGGGKFKDVAPDLGVTGPDFSFACWFWDFDNDGRLDIYVNDYRARVAEVLASAMGIKFQGSSRPRLYRNLGADGFRDVSEEVGLDRAMAPMGANFGDIDNDGYLDIYLGTGDMSYEGLDVNLLFKNVDGFRFDDATTSSFTGHLQKGHGVSFADWDGDGDLDLFVELGGATPGDRAFNALFENPCQGRKWLKVKLTGTKTNRAALGARIRVDLKTADGLSRSIHRTIGNNSSFGGNSLVETIGLLDANRALELVVWWPTSGTTQTFRDLDSGQSIEIVEGSAGFKVLSPPGR